MPNYERFINYSIVLDGYFFFSISQDEDKEEMKEILEMKRTHERIVAKRKQRDAELKGGKGQVRPVRDYPTTKDPNAVKKPKNLIL